MRMASGVPDTQTCTATPEQQAVDIEAGLYSDRPLFVRGSEDMEDLRRALVGAQRRLDVVRREHRMAPLGWLLFFVIGWLLHGLWG